MTWYNYNPDDYAVGSPLFVANGRWGARRSVAEYVVTKITPTKQVVAVDKRNSAIEIRVSKSGSIFGDSGYSHRSVVSAKTAALLMEEDRVKREWWAIAAAGVEIDKAARKHDAAALDKALSDLAIGIAARSDETRSGSAEGKSPAIAQKDHP